MGVVSSKLLTHSIVIDANGALGQLSDCIGVFGTILAFFFQIWGTILKVTGTF